MPTPDLDTARPEERTRAASRTVMWFALVLLAALWLSVVRVPWPLPLVPGVLGLAAVVLGVLALVRMRGARLGASMTVLVVVGMVIAAGLALLTSVQAFLWPVYSDFYSCLDRALTHQAQDTCFSELEQRTQTYLLNVGR